MTTSPSFPTTKKHDTDDDMVLFRQYQTTKQFDANGKLIKTDQVLRNKLVVRNQRLVLFIINKFFGHRQLQPDVKDDLIQEGMLGLFDAIDNFDPELGFKFSTYATWWLKQACSNFLMDLRPTLHVPSHVRTIQNRIIRELGPNNEGLKDLDAPGAAERFDITPKMLSCIKAALRSKWVQSINDPITDGLTVADTIPDDASSQADEGIDTQTMIQAATTALHKLTDRERLILLLRYNVIQEI